MPGNNSTMFYILISLEQVASQLGQTEAPCKWLISRMNEEEKWKLLSKLYSDLIGNDVSE